MRASCSNRRFRELQRWLLRAACCGGVMCGLVCAMPFFSLVKGLGFQERFLVAACLHSLCLYCDSRGFSLWDKWANGGSWMPRDTIEHTHTHTHTVAYNRILAFSFWCHVMWAGHDVLQRLHGCAQSGFWRRLAVLSHCRPSKVRQSGVCCRTCNQRRC